MGFNPVLFGYVIKFSYPNPSTVYAPTAHKPLVPELVEGRAKNSLNLQPEALGSYNGKSG